MESEIKVKATNEQISMFFQLCCVKCYELIEWNIDSKRRNLYDVRLRHAEDLGKLRGTYTVETLLKKCMCDAEANLHGNICGKVAEIVKVLSFIGKKERLADELNKALREYGLEVKTAEPKQLTGEEIEMLRRAIGSHTDVLMNFADAHKKNGNRESQMGYIEECRKFYKLKDKLNTL